MKLLFLALLGVVATAVDDICSSADTGLVDPQQLAIACYAGTFLVKMLAELNAGPALGPTRKTQQHGTVYAR